MSVMEKARGRSSDDRFISKLNNSVNFPMVIHENTGFLGGVPQWGRTAQNDRGHLEKFEIPVDS